MRNQYRARRPSAIQKRRLPPNLPRRHLQLQVPDNKKNRLGSFLDSLALPRPANLKLRRIKSIQKCSFLFRRSSIRDVDPAAHKRNSIISSIKFKQPKIPHSQTNRLIYTQRSKRKTLRPSLRNFRYKPVRNDKNF